MMPMPLQENNEFVMRLEGYIFYTLIHRLSALLWYQDLGVLSVISFFNVHPARFGPGALVDIKTLKLW